MDFRGRIVAGYIKCPIRCALAGDQRCHSTGFKTQTVSLDRIRHGAAGWGMFG